MNETAGCVRYRCKDARQECRAENHRQKRVRSAGTHLLRSSQPGETTAHERRYGRLQQKRLFWIGEFCQCGNQITAVGALNDRLVTGELSIQGKAGARDPDKRMKPQRAKSNFMDKAYQVVAPSCMCQLVDKNGVEFMLTQQPVNSLGKRDVRMQNPVHRRTLPTPGHLIGTPWTRKFHFG